MPRLRAGLIVNPLAGLGGAVALKGTDGVAAEALARGAKPEAGKRVQTFLAALGSRVGDIDWSCCPAQMGADILGAFVKDFTVIGSQNHSPSARGLPTSAEDTRKAAQALDGKVDLLLFAGGDGTARDLVDAAQSVPAVLGIPAGVKMHSGVFASSPSAAAALVARLLDGELLSVTQGEVRDLDEAALRQGQVRARHYGALPVPADLRYLQHVKQGGSEAEPLVIEDLAAELDELRQSDALTLIGAGTTLAGVMSAWGLGSSLMGIDALESGALVGSDLAEAQIWELLASGKPANLLLSFTGGQGYVFGRGNQQLSPRCLRRIGKQHIHILATKRKLEALEGRPLLIDTGERQLDEAFAGLARITTGYQDQVYYRLEAA